MDRVRRVALLLSVLALALLVGCGEEPAPDYAGQAIKAHERLDRLQAQSAEAQKESLVRGHQLERAQELLAETEARAQEVQRQAERERIERQGAESALEAAAQDFTVACVVAFSVALLALLLLALLTRERRQRMVMGTLLQWITRRMPP